jgi:MFS family permease
MLEASFRPEDRSRAIGAWTGLGGIAAAAGPLVGGSLVQYANWRWVFLLNLPLAAVTVMVALRWVPETRDSKSSPHFDLLGATLGVVGLAGITFALIEAGALSTPFVMLAAAIGVLAMVAFVFAERAEKMPMLPVGLFGSRQFSAANAMTFLVYAALGAIIFFLVIQLQTVVGYGPLRAGVATLPLTVVMLLLAARGGALAARIGPRLPMSLGPVVTAGGIALLAGVDSHATYWVDVFPGLTIFALGLALLVAPLTATVLGAAPDRYAGIASGVNNAVARGGSLLAVAALPFAVGLSGDDYNRPAVFSVGYERAMWICVALLVAGGAISFALIRNPHLPVVAPTP